MGLLHWCDIEVNPMKLKTIHQSSIANLENCHICSCHYTIVYGLQTLAYF